MWKPTAGIIIGFIDRRSFWKGSYVEIVFESHTGKRFTIDMPIQEVVGRKRGDAIFCNGNICKWYPNYESALDRLKEINN